MPIISRTERQTTVSGTPQPFASGDRGAIGRGISAIGNAISGLGAQAEEQENYEYKMKLSDFMYGEQKALDDGIANYKGDGKAFATEWEAGYQERAAAFAQQFGGKTGQRAQLDVRQIRNSAGMKALNAQQGFITQNNLGLLEAHASRVGTSIDGSTESVQRALQALDGAIEQVPGITPRMRNAARAKAADAMWKSWAAKASPEQMEKALADFEAGADDWRKKFSADQVSAAPGDLGSVSAKYESGGRGVAFVSTGAGDPGGPSYGVHQLSSKDSMPAFIRSPEGRKYAEKFQGLSVGSAEFNRVYKDISSQDPQGMAAAQKAFYTRTHYEPAKKAAESAGFDVSDRGVQEALFSIGVQHGGAKRIIASASSSGDARQQVQSLFEARAAYVERLTSLPEGTKQSVLNRYTREVRDAMALAGTKGGAPTTPGNESEPRGVDPETGEPAMISARERDKLALPERATIGDHAVNEFQGMAPQIAKIVQAEKQRRAAVEWVGGVMNGQIQFNKHDDQGRKLIDQMVDVSGVGQRIFEGDPMAAAQASQLALKMQYTPKAIWNGLRGLTENADPKKQVLGWTVVNNMVAANPNIFGGQSGADEVTRKAELVRVLQSQHGIEKGLKVLAEMDAPENKRLREAAKKDVDKFMKPYGSQAEAAKLIAKEMDTGWFWQTAPATDGSGKQRSAMVADYTDLLKYHYEAHGDETTAKAYALHDFKKKHGESFVTGTRVMMPYPPERFYRTDGSGSHDYIKEDLMKSVTGYAPDVKKETVRLIADRRTQQEAATGAPSYMVQFIRADGRVEMLRYQPPKDSGLEKKFGEKRGEALKKRDEQRQQMQEAPPMGEMGIP